MKGLSNDYPLRDVEISAVKQVSSIVHPLAEGVGWQSGPHEFLYTAAGTGSFYARDGKSVQYSTVPGADPEWVDLYLNTQVLVALLHQRGIINFHASSFIYNGQGVIVLGDTGAGKSSLTVSFAMDGAGFLTDDLTPVIFREGLPFIWPLHRDVKLREDTVSKLGVSPARLRYAEAGTGKQYLEIDRADTGDHSLDMILKIEVADCSRTEFHEPPPAEGFSILRSEICSGEILAGMPETEAAYLQQLLDMVKRVRMFKVIRPAMIHITDFYESVRSFISSYGGEG